MTFRGKPRGGFAAPTPLPESEVFPVPDTVFAVHDRLAAAMHAALGRVQNWQNAGIAMDRGGRPIHAGVFTVEALMHVEAYRPIIEALGGEWRLNRMSAEWLDGSRIYIMRTANNARGRHLDAVDVDGRGVTEEALAVLRACVRVSASAPPSEWDLAMMRLRGIEPPSARPAPMFREARVWNEQQQKERIVVTGKPYPIPDELLEQCPTCGLISRDRPWSVRPPYNRTCAKCRRVVCGACPIGNGEPRCALCGVMLEDDGNPF